MMCEFAQTSVKSSRLIEIRTPFVVGRHGGHWSPRTKQDVVGVAALPRGGTKRALDTAVTAHGAAGCTVSRQFGVDPNIADPAKEFCHTDFEGRSSHVGAKASMHTQTKRTVPNW